MVSHKAIGTNFAVCLLAVLVLTGCKEDKWKWNDPENNKRAAFEASKALACPLDEIKSQQAGFAVNRSDLMVWFVQCGHSGKKMELTCDKEFNCWANVR